jgi:hypothetical protein
MSRQELTLVMVMTSLRGSVLPTFELAGVQSRARRSERSL